MPEYLSPGVFVEEVPGRFKALEGVSTSTAAFVGPAQRGPVAGDSLPFIPTNGFVLNPDPAPAFITSFAEFTRQFGFPLPLVTSAADPDYGYLAQAVRGFFDNGGKRCYVARIVNTPPATRSQHRVEQGVVYHLLKRAKTGDTEVSLDTLRGLQVGTGIQFRRRSDESNALVLPATPATILGTLDVPLALQNGDFFSVTVTPPGAPAGEVTMTAIDAQPRAVSAAFAGTLVNTDTLSIRVGPPTEPTQTVTFSPLPTTADEVVNFLSARLTGVQVFKTGAATINIQTDHRGKDVNLSQLFISAVPASGDLPFPVGMAPFLAGANNVDDLNHVRADEINTLFGPSGLFTVTKDSMSNNLLITSTATGTVSMALLPAPPAGVLARFGLAGGVVITAGGGGGAPPVLSVVLYNTLAGTITLNAALTTNLDPTEVYAVATLAVPSAGGPQFYGRSRGSWSGDVSIAIAPADRTAVRVTTAPVLPSATVEVQNASSFYVGAIVEVDHAGSSKSYHEVASISGRILTLSTDITGTALNTTNSFVRVVEIDLTITDESGAAPVEVYRGVSWNQGAKADLRRHYAQVINARSRLVFVQPPGTGSPPGPVLSDTEAGSDIDEQPTTTTGFAERMSTVGNDGLPDQGPAGDAAYIGTDGGPGLRTGIESLKDLSEARIIAAPGRTTQPVQLALITQCELLRYRFAILDAPQDKSDVGQILTHRNLYDTSFAAYYTPWLGVNLEGQTRYLPPSGIMAGIYARTDNRRGVWKAPANESPFNVVDLKTNFTTGEQDILNPRGVNLIRRFDQGGIRVWGARTLSSDPEVKYINVRRTLIFLEATIDRNTQWVVFEPNTPDTWATVTSSITAFLETQWREGALFGRSPDQAFFVRCDETTMSADDIQNGRLITQIGVAIVRPAEFVIFRIEQITGFAKQ